MQSTAINSASLEKLVRDAKASGGGERANYQKFITELAQAYGLESPHFSRDDDADNNYVFERRIKFNHPDGTSTPGWIDCYKRGSFILEAKQSPKRQRQREDQQKTSNKNQLSFFAGAQQDKAKPTKTGWDQIMLSARRQAEDYAKALPVDHGYPPFLLIVDVGHVIEVYADFSGQGKNYAHFPDRQNFRISMDDLLDEKVQARLKAIWTDPQSLDPTRISAIVTKDVAERLAKIATALEAKKHDATDVAEFLMRCLFTMFAEDAKLLPDKAFERLLNDLKDAPENFVPAMESLWKAMNAGEFAPYLSKKLMKFNGGLFQDSKALPLEKDQIAQLYIAARREWKDVEPAIFGTLLERALNPRERSKLGAHYTPRTYVERLVIPTIIEPLRQDWQEVQDYAADLQLNGKPEEALAAVKDFHHKLCTTRVLDPACGTGNFLYVSLELMKRLEGDVLEALSAFGEDQARLALDGETVSPRQFYGLELNPRAVPIADLVLWLGYLKWQLKTAGLSSITEPVLHAYGTIKQQDALISYDSKAISKDDEGKPITVWDGTTHKTDPVSGVLVPDIASQIETYEYSNPIAASWPEAEYIVGNPPFIGRRRMRARLGKGYVDALDAAYPKSPRSMDLVMYWWERCASAKSKAKRFGLVTTNSIKQTFNRRIVLQAIGRPKKSVAFRFAIPDHPWTDEAGAADVRISMTVGQITTENSGRLVEVLSEATQAGSMPEVTYKETLGRINSQLRIGTDITDAKKLVANAELSHQGMILNGIGFRILPIEQQGWMSHHQYSSVVRDCYAGADFAEGRRKIRIVDLFGLSLDQVIRTLPHCYQWVLQRVKPHRDQVDDQKSKENWWIFTAPREELRDLLRSITRTIVTVRSATHRTFLFMESDVILDDGAVFVGSPKADHLAILSSRVHCHWTIAQAARLGVGNDVRYNKSECFDAFVFPELSSEKPASVELDVLGERLDAFRKERLAAHDFLTMTGLYNALERYRELNAGIGQPLTPEERDVHEAGLISVLAEIHDDIDRATLSAYGWDDLAPALVGKVGGTVPSDHKSESQLEAEEILLTRLVALNHERAEEEKRGVIRWLRPEYQIPKLGAKAPKGKTEELDLEIVETLSKPKWPSDDQLQVRAIFDALKKSESLTSPETIAAAFDGRNSAQRKTRVAKVLETLVITGAARTTEDGSKYFVAR
jgi:hypothetical protein